MSLLLHDNNGKQICEINLARKVANKQKIITIKGDAFSPAIQLPLDKAYELADIIVAIAEENERRETASK